MDSAGKLGDINIYNGYFNIAIIAVIEDTTTPREDKAAIVMVAKLYFRCRSMASISSPALVAVISADPNEATGTEEGYRVRFKFKERKIRHLKPSQNLKNVEEIIVKKGELLIASISGENAIIRDGYDVELVCHTKGK